MQALEENEDFVRLTYFSEPSSMSAELDGYSQLAPGKIIINSFDKQFETAFDSELILSRNVKSPATLSDIFGSNNDSINHCLPSMEDTKLKTPESFSCLTADPHVFVPVQLDEDSSYENHREATTCLTVEELANFSQYLAKVEQSSDDGEEKLFSTSDQIEIDGPGKTEWSLSDVAAKTCTEIPLKTSVDYVPVYAIVQKPDAHLDSMSQAFREIESLNINMNEKVSENLESSAFDLVMDSVNETAIAVDEVTPIEGKENIDEKKLLEVCNNDAEYLMAGNIKTSMEQVKTQFASMHLSESGDVGFVSKLHEMDDLESISVSIVYQFGSLDTIMGPDDEIFHKKSRLKKLSEVPDIRIVRQIESDYAGDPNYGEFMEIKENQTLEVSSAKTSKLHEMDDLESLSVSITNQFGSLDTIMRPDDEIFHKKSRLKELSKVPDIRIVRQIESAYAGDPNYGEFMKIKENQSLEVSSAKTSKRFEQPVVPEKTFEIPAIKTAERFKEFVSWNSVIDSMNPLDVGSQFPRFCDDMGQVDAEKLRKVDNPTSSRPRPFIKPSEYESAMADQVNVAIHAALSEGLVSVVSDFVDEQEINEAVGCSCKLVVDVLLFVYETKHLRFLKLF